MHGSGCGLVALVNEMKIYSVGFLVRYIHKNIINKDFLLYSITLHKVTCVNVLSYSNNVSVFFFQSLVTAFLLPSPPPMIRYFNEFLMTHSRETAEQVRSEYVDTMGKMYYSYFKDYLSKLMKLQVCAVSFQGLIPMPHSQLFNVAYVEKIR